MGSLCFNIERKIRHEKNAVRRKQNFPKALIFSFYCAHVSKLPTAFAESSASSHLILEEFYDLLKSLFLSGTTTRGEALLKVLSPCRLISNELVSC